MSDRENGMEMSANILYFHAIDKDLPFSIQILDMSAISP
jgi:hypothetical protein